MTIEELKNAVCKAQIDGELIVVFNTILTVDDVMDMAEDVMEDDDIDEFEANQKPFTKDDAKKHIKWLYDGFEDSQELPIQENFENWFNNYREVRK